MSQSEEHKHINRRSWGRFYVAPVLLDHRSYKRILLSFVVLGVGSFFGGYISGFEKAEDVLMAEMGSMDLVLPVVDISELAMVEAQVPEIEEPGASIDVDSADLNVVDKVTVKKPAVVKSDKKLAAVVSPAKTSPEVKQVTEAKPVDIPLEQKTEVVEEVIAEAPVKPLLKPIIKKPVIVAQAETSALEPKLPEALGIGGPPTESHIKVFSGESRQASVEPQTIETQNIVDDASEETARYSIQVGMYSSFDNAANRVEELLDKKLNAYIHDYKNKQDKTRYNVRFGYFATLASAKQALSVFEQNYAGSGYVARINR